MNRSSPVRASSLRGGTAGALALAALSAGCSLLDLGPLSESAAGAGGQGATSQASTADSSTSTTSSSAVTGTSTSATSAGGGGQGSVGAGGGGGCGAEVDFQTDSENCGSCGRDCFGGDCEAGLCRPAVLASGFRSPRYLVADDTHLFVSDAATSPDGGVHRVRKRLPEERERIATQPTTWGLALRGETLYFTTPDEGAGVFAVPKDGSAVESLVYASSSVTEVAVAPGASSLFFAEYSSDGGDPADRILRFDDKATFFLGNAQGCETMVARAGQLYVGGGSLRRVGFDGGGFSTLSGLPSRRMALDEDWLYLLSYYSADINAVGVDGVDERLVATGQEDALDGEIAVDATHVYWTIAARPGAVLRAPKDGSGQAEIFADEQPHPTGLVVDGAAVYWVVEEQGRAFSGRIMIQAK